MSIHQLVIRLLYLIDILDFSKKIKSNTMKSSIIILSSFLLVSGIFFSCSNDDDPEVEKSRSVCVGGYEILGELLQAKIWKDNLSVISIGDQAVVNSITYAGGAVYLAGYMNAAPKPTGEIYTRAVYWKDSTPVFLTDGQSGAYANDIAVVNGEVYVCGIEYNASKVAVAKYWKNGVPVSLSGGINSAEARGIAVDKNIVYVCGIERIRNKNIVKYWKNGNSISLSSNSGNASDIEISGSDVYVSGYDFAPGSYIPTAKYWKNSAEILLSDGLIEAAAYGICISNNNVFVVGYNDSRAAIWRNGQLNYLASSGVATDVCISGNDEYISGMQHLDDQNVAFYWKNGEGVKLSDKFSFASCITVVP